jgi:hypothetical protein
MKNDKVQIDMPVTPLTFGKGPPLAPSIQTAIERYLVQCKRRRQRHKGAKRLNQKNIILRQSRVEDYLVIKRKRHGSLLKGSKPLEQKEGISGN